MCFDGVDLKRSGYEHLPLTLPLTQSSGSNYSRKYKHRSIGFQNWELPLSSGFQNVVLGAATSATLGELLGIEIFSPHIRQTEPGTLGGPSSLFSTTPGNYDARSSSTTVTVTGTEM